MPQLPLARQTSLGRRASPDDFGGGAGDQAQAFTINRGAEITSQLFEAEGQSQVAIRLAQASTELNEFQAELQEDPDFRNHEARFADFQKETVQKHGDSLSIPKFRGEFNRRIAAAAEQTRVKVHDFANAKAIDLGRAQGTEAVTILSRLAGQSETSDERGAYLSQLGETIQGMERDGLITATAAVKLRQSVVDDMTMGDVLKEIREDPEGAAQSLLAGEFGLDPDQTQRMVDKALKASDVELRRQQVGLERERKQTDRIRKEQERTANRNLTLKAAPGTAGITEQDVLNEPHLSTSDFREFMTIVGNGGTLRDSVSNPEINADLRRRARAGDLTALDEATQQYKKGELSSADWKWITEQGEVEKRYELQFDSLDRVLELAKSQLDSDSVFIVLERYDQAERTFRDALEKDPKMSQKDAWEITDDLRRSIPILSAESMAATQLPPDPRFTLRQGIVINGPGTALRLNQALRQGETDEEGYASNMERLNNVLRIQAVRDQ